MSSGADCHFTEIEPDKWKYAIQQWPYGDIEDYDRHGPFPTFTAALAHLDANYQNPGGWSSQGHPDHKHSGPKDIDKSFGDTWLCCGDKVQKETR
jgi:hypothetical protein